MSDNYSLLINKLDAFIRKHYLNQLLRGAIYAVAILVATFMLVSAIEYFYYLPATGRKVLFFGFIAGGAAVLYKLVGEPLLHYYKLGKIISHEQAAQIIGRHFSNVQDRLLNILQLKKQSESQAEKDLIIASINQKTESIKLVPFTSAIDLRKNNRYARLLLLPLFAVLVVLISATNVIKDGTTRLINSGTNYERPAPFTFKVNNKEMKAIQYGDFLLDVTVEGEVLPDDLYIKVDGYPAKMNRKSASHYEYKFVNLQQKQDFVMTASGFDSKAYTIEVLPKPVIMNFEVMLDYPAYTGKNDEAIKNIGDLTIPAGTKVLWELNARSTDEISFGFGDKKVTAERNSEQRFTLAEIPAESGYYVVKVSNEHLRNADSISYSITVVPDLHPSISVQALEDSANLHYLYFMGEISDDYGLSKLQLKYNIQKEDEEPKEAYEVIPVSFAKGAYARFSHYWDLKTLGLKPGEGVTYFFEVWDNDGIHGSKSTRSTILQFRMPSEKELDLQVKESNEKIEQGLDETIMKAADLKKELQEAREKLLQKKDPLSWEEKQAMKELMEKQKSVEEAIREMQEELKNNMTKQSEYKELRPEILEKQKKIQELIDEVLSDEMKEMLNKMQSLMEQMDMDQMMEQLKDFEMTEEQLEKELSRMLDLFKSLQFEQKLAETVDKLEKLAQEQEKLSEETKNESKSNEDLQKEQEKLNEEFEDVQESLKEMEKLKEELGEEDGFQETKENAEQVKQEMSQGSQNLQQSKNKKASENQKSAAQKMQQMSEQLAQMQSDMQMEQMEMDMRAIRQLLENLVTLSLDQEDLMAQVAKASINDPRYVTLTQEQNKIKDDTELVKDSLFALSKRVFQLQTYINKEVAEVTKNLDKSIHELADRKKNDAAVHQQYVMTGFNNLALMLSEALQQMQQQMASQMQGNQQCQKNKGKGMPTPKLGEMQKQLNDQITKMQEQLKKQGPGEQGKMPGMSKELVEQAAKQAAIREALKKLKDQEGDHGELGKEMDKLIDEMDKTETDLYNNKLNEQMKQRNQQILTRLLEVEESIRQREQSNERKSETGQEIAREIPPSLEEYLKQRDAEIELYKTVPPSLKPYYRQMVENYFKSISF